LSLAQLVGTPLIDLGISEKNLWRAAALTFAFIALFSVFGWVEAALVPGGGSLRFIQNAAESATRCFTIPHVIIGFAFMVTASRSQTASRRMLIAALLLFGTLLSVGYSRVLGGGHYSLATVLLYGYFLIHELRDEASFYCMFGDGPQTRETDKQFRSFTWGLVVLTVAAVVAALLLSYTSRADVGVLTASEAPTIVLVSTAMVVLGLLAAGWLLFSWYAERTKTSVAALVHEHRRLLRLFVSVLLVTLVGVVFTGRLYSVVLLHVLVWYVFVSRRLRERPPTEAPRGLWPWMRGTYAGFHTLHLGLAAVVTLVWLVGVYGPFPTSPVWALVSPESLPYWTIMHITVSFVPR
jgi:hypothetical protein